jgi:Rieske Fe-S protein
MKKASAPFPRCAGLTTTTGRRSVLKGAATTFLELVFLRGATFAQDDPLSVRPKAGDLLVRAADSGAAPLTASDVPQGPPVLAWPMDPADRVVRNGSRFNQVLLLRLDPMALSAQTRARAADGIVAYTTICTHSGCDVADWIADDQLLLCSCHSSTFDPRDGARVTDGPAPRSLPALPLAISDGMLVVAGGFTDRVGFEAA